MADLGVLIELRRFLAGIHSIRETPDKREVDSSSLLRPIRHLRVFGGSMPANWAQTDLPMLRGSLPDAVHVRPLTALKRRLGGLPTAQIAEHLERQVREV